MKKLHKFYEWTNIDENNKEKIHICRWIKIFYKKIVIIDYLFDKL